jgi:hypothetical protein
MYLDSTSSDVIELIPEYCKGTSVETVIIPEAGAGAGTNSKVIHVHVVSMSDGGNIDAFGRRR